MSIRSLGFLIFLSIFFLGTQFPGHAQGALEIQDEEAEVSFGDEIVFSARLHLPDQEGRTTLFIRPREGFRTTSAEVTPGISGRVQHSYELEGVLLPPFSSVEYWYQWEGVDGGTLVSPTFSFDYFDNRFTWRTLESPPIRLHWVEGDVQFAQEALDIARESLLSIQEDLPAETDATGPESWIDIYVYPSAEDLRTALTQGGESWLAGHADPQLGVILASIPPGLEQTTEMERQIPHELGHVLLYRRTGAEYSNLPTWLNEGIASHYEAYANPNYPILLENAYADGLLFPADSLCRAFPASASDTLLAYAQSASFVNYLFSEHGTSGINRLIDEYADGKSCDRGAEVALSKPLASLERDWRQAVFGEDAWRNLVPWVGLAAIVFLPMLLSVFFHRRPSG